MQALPLPSGRKRGCRGGKRTRGGHGNLHRVKEAQEARAARRAAVLEAVTADVLELFDTIVADGEIVEQQAGAAEGGEQGCTGAEGRVAPVPAPARPTARAAGFAEQSHVDELGFGFVGSAGGEHGRRSKVEAHEALGCRRLGLAGDSWKPGTVGTAARRNQ